MLFRFFFSKTFAIKALIFTDAMVPNSFQVSFTLILTIVLKRGRIVVGLSNSGIYERGLKTRGDKLGNRIKGKL